MEIRDPVHGHIHILDEEVPIIHNEFFQRLRNIKQLGLSEYVFPGATHSRFLHSLGVMSVGEKAFNRLFSQVLDDKNFQRLKETFKLACLLHDVGHAPLSHSTESVMPMLSELEIPKQFLSIQDLEKDRQATHEDYTIKSIADSSFAKSFEQVERKFGLERKFIADLIVGSTNDSSYFTINGINYFPILHQLVSSELDCDRMDYLLRDSYFCGVSYGNYDLDWLLDSLSPAIVNNEATLGISERAVVTFDDFLLSRYHMFTQVYFHYKAVCLERLLVDYFKTSPDEYKIPANIEEYIEHDDHFLMKVLRKSKSPYAQRIVKNDIPKKIYESFNQTQLDKLEEVQAYLKSEDLNHIRCSSKHRLSKYYGNERDRNSNKYSMKVVRKSLATGNEEYSDINEATELFQRFSSTHAINRLHCDLDILSELQKKKLFAILKS